MAKINGKLSTGSISLSGASLRSPIDKAAQDVVDQALGKKSSEHIIAEIFKSQAPSTMAQEAVTMINLLRKAA